MVFDARHIGAKLTPTVAARLREIVRTCMEMQGEAGALMAAEAERLSASEDEEMQARAALAEWYHGLALAAANDEAKLARGKAS